MKLKIGKIPYANLFPIFYILKKECDCSSYEFIEEVPSNLNKMLRFGEIDVSPSSSIEYLKNPFLYQIIEGHSISSKGPIGSIFLFSKRDIKKLNGCIIHASSQSETSTALLDIILKKFYGLQCKFYICQKPENSDSEAFLLIGDDAIRFSLKGRNLSKLISYDLGQIWYQHTGLPFVFALWIARKDISDKELFNKFVKDLNKAKKIALENLPKIVKHSPMRAYMSENKILSYWKMIDYELTEDNKKGLELFGMYLKELSLL